MLALLVVAAILSPPASTVRLLHALSHGKSTLFAGAQKKARRTLSAFLESRQDDRVEFAAEACSVEMEAVESGTPRKITFQCRFASRQQARDYIASLLIALARPLNPPFSDPVSGDLAYRGTMVAQRRLVGMEIDLIHDDSWRAVLLLIEGGPRIVIPER
ncbi:MAG TPA: hypothetical protein VKH35_05610 [Thermoanaerobaculia bacterium]|jgi:hypothetical protein|nr:hypothetical protein [Thermoanaerobaculia bacterium]